LVVADIAADYSLPKPTSILSFGWLSYLILWTIRGYAAKPSCYTGLDFKILSFQTVYLLVSNQLSLNHSNQFMKNLEIKIRQCSSVDIDTLKTIAYETYDDTFRSMNTKKTIEAYLEQSFNKSKLLSELDNKSSKFYFLYSGNILVGYLKINEELAQTDIRDHNSLEIERIYIKKEYKGNGYGKYLIEHSIQLAIEMKKHYIWLGVWENNIDAIQFYKRMGFTESGRHFFRMGDELQIDLILKREISKPKTSLENGPV
jgi:ribosomal protein S18 acetylase RimI-like enzyme